VFQVPCGQNVVTQWGGSQNSWSTIAGTTASRVAAQPEGLPVVVTTTGQINAYNGVGTWVPYTAPFTAVDVGVGFDGSLWAASSSATSNGIWSWNSRQAKWI